MRRSGDVDGADQAVARHEQIVRACTIMGDLASGLEHIAAELESWCFVCATRQSDGRCQTKHPDAYHDCPPELRARQADPFATCGCHPRSSPACREPIPPDTLLPTLTEINATAHGGTRPLLDISAIDQLSHRATCGRRRKATPGYDQAWRCRPRPVIRPTPLPPRRRIVLCHSRSPHPTRTLLPFDRAL